ncbi:MAG: hypothetical protein LHV69_09595 [Elusimicrobia bacterium]|nr:hypothetical protein [Candidatus Obscuribacterium magneticum]
MMTPAKNPFGLLAFLHWNHEWNNYHFPEALLPKAVDQLAELGVPMIRMDILWSDIDRGSGRTDFGRYDAIVDLLMKKNIGILALLQYNKDFGEGENLTWNKMPASFDEFADYVKATVSHFKSRIKHWEIWNEPNHPEYWAHPKDDLKKYTELLRVSYQAAKRADPECVVMNGGITEPLLEDVTHLYENGGRDITDRLAIHFFIDPFAPDREERVHRTIDGVRDVMKRFGDEKKKIWITEVGCPGIPPHEKPQAWFGGGTVGEDEQADWLETLYRLIKKHPVVEKLFWAFYRDTGTEFKDAANYMGLVRFDLSPKPAYHRLQKLMKGSGLNLPRRVKT